MTVASTFKPLRPADLARAAGVSPQTVRRYERWGVIPPATRSVGGHRRYGPAHLAALRTARRLVAGYRNRDGIRVMRLVHGGRGGEALAVADERHGDLHAQRALVVAALRAFRELFGGDQAVAGGPARPVQIGEASAAVGVGVSVLRFWEQQGLLRPSRRQGSRYRLYDGEQLRRAHLIALLRRSGYALPAVGPVLDAIAAGRPDLAERAVARRLTDLAEQSQRCCAATAALWAYLRALPGPAVDPGPREHGSVANTGAG